MPDVRLPDGRVARFPDDMPREQIKGIIAEKFPQQAGTPNAMPQKDFDERFAGIGSQGGPLDAAVQGLSFGFSDELLGLIAGGAALAQGKGLETAGKVRNAFTQDQRNRLTEYRDRKPGEAIASEIGGALPTAFIPMGALGRAAQGGNWLKSSVAAGLQGGLLGGLYGAGTADGGMADRAKGAGLGAGTGFAVGTAAQPVLRGLGAGLNRVVAPFTGLFNPEGEAAKRVAAAMTADSRAATPGIGPAQEALARRYNQPILNVDRGGEATRDLARAASNISSEGRSAIMSKLDPRFEGQGSRVVDAVQRMVGGKNVSANREVLQSMARKANKPAYERAYGARGADAVWDEALKDLTGADVVQTAIRQATATARNDAALSGFTPIKNPFRSDPQTGRMVPKDGVVPSLQFWDHVKRNLDKLGTRDAKMAARVLRDHLDVLVPEYKDARAGAARFFGQEDALSAGEAFVSSKMQNEEARRALGKMSDAERRLFAEGFADGIVRKVQEVGDRRNVVINGMFSSPASRERITLALGEKKAKELEAVLRVEGLMDLARQAMGNSTTARQLAAMGIATGGTGMYGLGTGDWRPAAGLLVAALTKRGISAIDVSVMKRVAEKLASSDPNVVQEGIAAVARDERMLDVLRRLTASGTVSQAAPAVAN